MRVSLQLLSLVGLLGVSGGMTNIRGMDPDFASFYDPAKNFQCMDGSAVMAFSRINDDYCDCPDGSDEPGTAACSNGSFYCPNRGFRAGKIPSSRVNDGICDCCDGSDEWEASPSCGDVCYEMGAAARAERARRNMVREAGLRLKEDLIAQGQQIFKIRREELSDKEAQLADLSGQKEALEAVKEEKEGLEKAALEVYREIEERERLLKEEEDKLQKENELKDKFNSLDVNSDGKIEASELMSNNHFDQNNDGIVSEEEASFYMSGLESYDLESFKSQGLLLMEPALENKAGPPPTIPLEEEEEEPKEEIDYEDLDEIDDEVRPPHLSTSEDEEEELELDKEEESSKTESSLKYDDETQRLIEEANKARTDFESVERNVRDLENDITNLKRVIDNDYGPHKEFLPLSKECFEFSDQEYVYKMCTFDHCTQRSKNGGSETRLGDWSHWSSPFSQMKYEKGTQCWNGPQRSTAVSVICGTENKLTAVSEPSKCEYFFQFESPAACSMQSKEDEEYSSHDEL